MSSSEASSGPTAKRQLGNEGTGLSAAGASFISANCSPFSPPQEIITGPPKVCDPRNHESSCTAYIWKNFTINVNNSGDQFVALNANPLAPLPVVWAINQNGDNTTTSAKTWATAYEDVGLSDMFCQIKSLAENSRNYTFI